MGSRSTHSHSHSHAPGQAHSHRHDTNEQRIGLAALLTGLFMGAEVVGGIVSGSLALLADAAGYSPTRVLRHGDRNSYRANGRQRICAPRSMDSCSGATTTNPPARLS